MILGMDDHNMEAIRALRPDGGHARIGRLGAYVAPGEEDATIIDPWGQSRDVFEAVFDQIRTACERLAQFARTAQPNTRTGSEDHGFRN